MRDIWNPWHGCRKCSPGCDRCYMYALDARRGIPEMSSRVVRTKSFEYPLKKSRDGTYKLRPGERIRVNMTSDTFIEDADPWRPRMWEIIKIRSDLAFWLLTKRANNIASRLPPDWGPGYPNVMLNLTCENQEAFDNKWPIFEKIPAKAKGICCAPLIGRVDLSQALASGQICEVSAGGENYDNPRPCDYEWFEALHKQCAKYHVSFSWYETGTYLVKGDPQHGWTKHELPYKADQAKLAGLAGLNLDFGRPPLVLRDPDDGHILTDAELHVPMYNPIHCLGCGNRPMCNGCDPACKQRDKSYRLVTAAELDALEAAKFGTR